jgi:hypothetical protein
MNRCIHVETNHGGSTPYDLKEYADEMLQKDVCNII